MPRNTNFWSWIVFVICVGAYVPIVIGGIRHHGEINMAGWVLWAIISCMMLYSSHSEGFVGWRLALGFLVGNISMIILGLSVGGYTFNLGPAEMIGLYGIVTVLSFWVAVGTITKKWSNHILVVGTVATDLLSFYPQLKQYLLPHESPTALMLVGWSLFALGTFVNFVFVEQLFVKLTADEMTYRKLFERKNKNLLSIFEESAYSIENCAAVTITILVMIR